MDELVKSIPNQKISLYIHIPFCRKKCAYCDFFSVTDYSSEIIKKVFDGIYLQLEKFLKLLNYPEIQTIYIGGGTPCVIPAGLLADFITGIQIKLQANPIEWTIELNPEFVNKELLNILEDSGISRISMGVQSFNNRLLKILGRSTDEMINHGAVKLLFENWKGDLSFDLICGIPGQSVSDALQDVETLLSYNPSHLSLYTLTLEAGTPLEAAVKKRTIKPLSEKLHEEIWFNCSERITAEGLIQYEISNYALSGKESQHNLNYWNMLPYIGCGPGSVSTIPGKNCVIRLENSRSLTDFFAKPDDFETNHELLPPKEFLFEHFLMGFRLKKGISRERIKRIFGVDPLHVIKKSIANWSKLQLLEIDGDCIRLNLSGQRLLDKFLIDILGELDNSNIDNINWP